MLVEGFDGAAKAFAEVAHGYGFFVGQVFTVFGELQHAAHFAVGAFGDVEQACEILVGLALEALCDVVHHGSAAALDLVAKTEVACGNRVFSERNIDRIHLDPCVLPNPEVFKSLRGHDR